MIRLARGLPGVLAISALLVVVVDGAPAEEGRPAAGPSVGALRALLLGPASSDRTRIRASDMLGKLDDPAAESALVEALEAPSAAGRFGAARALGRPGRSAAVGPLARRLDDPRETPRVRAAAARSLGVIGEQRGLAALLRARPDPEAEVRLAVREALLEWSPSPVSRLALLEEILTDTRMPEPSRAYAAARLGQLRDPRAAPLLVGALEAGTPPESGSARDPIESLGAGFGHQRVLAVTAANALGDLGDRAAAPALARAARSPSAELRRAALAALTKLREAEGIAPAVAGLADADPRVRREAAVLLGTLEVRDAVPPLRGALEDIDAGVRLKAAWALGKMAAAEARDPLTRALEREAISEVRDALREALSALGAPVPR